MSSKGIYSAVSGAIAQSQRLDTIANNIANSSTTGFKKDTAVFSEYLTANNKIPDVIQVPRVPATTESFYDMQGGDKSLVDSAGTYADHSQGTLKNTGDTLDFALDGKGFFEVLTPAGVRYTRNGSFKLDGDGKIVTKEGYPVLSEGAGADPANRALKVNSANLTVSYSGEIFEGQNQIGKLSVVDFDNKDALQKQGGSLYALKPLYTQAPKVPQEFKVHQGFVEMSNVNIVDEMTQMIQTTRQFEANQAAIKAFDAMDDKLVNTVPRF